MVPTRLAGLKIPKLAALSDQVPDGRCQEESVLEPFGKT